MMNNNAKQRAKKALWGKRAPLRATHQSGLGLVAQTRDLIASEYLLAIERSDSDTGQALCVAAMGRLAQQLELLRAAGRTCPGRALFPNVRSVLELTLQCRFMMANRAAFQRRATQFQYANMLATRELLRGIGEASPSDVITSQLRQELAEIERALDAPEFLEVAAEWSKRSARRKNPEWYSLFGGPQSLRDLAAQVRSLDHYWHYKRMSKSTHAADLRDSFVRTEGGVEFRPILGAHETTHALSLCVSLSLEFLADYAGCVDWSVAGRLSTWYIAHRDAYLAIAASGDPRGLERDDKD